MGKFLKGHKKVGGKKKGTRHLAVITRETLENAIKESDKNNNTTPLTYFLNEAKKNPQVLLVLLKQLLANAAQKQAEKAEISIQWIIQELKQLYERCQSSLSSKGAIAGATRQLELLGKYLGMFTDKLEIKNDNLHITVSFENKDKHKDGNDNV